MTRTAWPSTPTKAIPKAPRQARNPRVLARSRSAGVTLPELLVVVTLIAVVGTFAMPSLNSLESLRITSATAELSAALRFAREEAIRTGAIHSVEFPAGSHAAQVLKITDFSIMTVNRPVVRHPVSRQRYRLDLDQDPGTSPTELRSILLTFDGVGAKRRVDFMPTGQPVWIDIFDQPYRLLNGSIVLRAQEVNATITLDGLTGRVSSS